MRRIAASVVAAMLLASLAGPASAAKPTTGGFLPPGQGFVAAAVATANLSWSAAPPFAQSGWANEKCGPSAMPRVWFLGGPGTNNVPYPGPLTCQLPADTFLVVEAADLLDSTAFGDPNTPRGQLASINDVWPNLTTVRVTFDGQTMVNPTAYVVTSFPVWMNKNDWIFSSDTPGPYLTMARYYQFVTRPLSRGTHTLQVHYEWAPGWFGTVDRDYTIIAN
jgi:hypothetical protein